MRRILFVLCLTVIVCPVYAQNSPRAMAEAFFSKKTIAQGQMAAV